MKRCSKCGTEKETSAFSPFKKSPDGLFSWCRACNAAATLARYHSRPDKKEYIKKRSESPSGRRAQKKARAKVTEAYRNDPTVREKMLSKQRLRYQTRPEVRKRLVGQAGGKRHGITPEEYFDRIARPCEICGNHDKRSKAMHVDHDHVTGRLRGTLCHHCNIGIGMFKDSPEKLAAAIQYLGKYA